MRRIQSIKPAGPALSPLLLWLIAALLFGQSFDAMHRVVHAPGGQLALAQPMAIGAADAAAQAVGKNSLARWFGIHSASDCALIDHALQPTPPAAPALLPAPLLIAALPPLAMVGIVPAGRRSFFEARGPPPLLVRSSSL